MWHLTSAMTLGSCSVCSIVKTTIHRGAKSKNLQVFHGIHDGNVSKLHLPHRNGVWESYLLKHETMTVLHKCAKYCIQGKQQTVENVATIGNWSLLNVTQSEGNVCIKQFPKETCKITLSESISWSMVMFLLKSCYEYNWGIPSTLCFQEFRISFAEFFYKNWSIWSDSQTLNNWLVVEPTHLKNISQNRNLPQIGMNIQNIWVATT